MSNFNETLSMACAEAIYTEFSNIEKPTDSWVVDKSSFLPANVLCDYAGQRWFINKMAKIIAKTVEYELIHMSISK